MPGVSVFYPLPVCILILLVVKKWKKPTYPHPPGPKGYPIIGNVMDLPTGAPIWESLTSLADRHGTFRGSLLGALKRPLSRHRYSILAPHGRGYGRPK